MRVAHRIKGFRQLPFIVTTNPKVLEVVRSRPFFPSNVYIACFVQMELYMESHAIITSFNKYCKRIVTMKEALEFTNLLQKRLDIHGNVINKLSQGFRLAFFYFLKISKIKFWKRITRLHHWLLWQWYGQGEWARTIISKSQLHLATGHSIACNASLETARSNWSATGDGKWATTIVVLGMGTFQWHFILLIFSF